MYIMHIMHIMRQTWRFLDLFITASYVYMWDEYNGNNTISVPGPYSFEKILDNRLTYEKKYGKIYREKLGQMDMVHVFDPSDIATMFRQEGKYPSRGKISSLEQTYLERNNKLIGFAFL